jgi:hypothetical protein
MGDLLDPHSLGIYNDEEDTQQIDTIKTSSNQKEGSHH